MAHRRYSTRTDKKRWSINLVKSTSVTHSTSWILRIQWYKINLLPVSQPREPRKWIASCLSSWLFHEAISKNYETKICSVKGSPASSGNISNKLFLATKGYKYEWVCKARPAPPPHRDRRPRWRKYSFPFTFHVRCSNGQASFQFNLFIELLWRMIQLRFETFYFY